MDVDNEKREWSPVYAGESVPPQAGMELYRCFYAAELCGPPLVDWIVDMLLRDDYKSVISNDDVIARMAEEALCSADETERLVCRIANELELNGEAAAREKSHPFTIMQLRWAFPDLVPDGSNYQKVEFYYIQENI